MNGPGWFDVTVLGKWMWLGGTHGADCTEPSLCHVWSLATCQSSLDLFRATSMPAWLSSPPFPLCVPRAAGNKDSSELAIRELAGF